MENMTALRTAYGSGPLEEFNPVLYPYRRNVAASITLTLFAVRSALVTKLPLPQFLPSARVAHLRMVNKVRAAVIDAVRHNNAPVEIGGEGNQNDDDADAGADEKVGHGVEEEVQNMVRKENEEDEAWISKQARRRAVRKKYLSWNAASAAQAEIIEFLEELVELAKLIVGANEFRSGVLARRRVFGGDHLHGGGFDAGGAGGSVGDKPDDGSDRNNITGKMAKAQTKDTRSGAHVDADGNADQQQDRVANIIDAAAPSPPPQHLAHPSTTRKGKRRGNTVTSIGSVASGTSHPESHPRAPPGSPVVGGGYIPVSLIRIQSRKREAAELRRVGTGDGEKVMEKGKGKGTVRGQGV